MPVFPKSSKWNTSRHFRRPQEDTDLSIGEPKKYPAAPPVPSAEGCVSCLQTTLEVTEDRMVFHCQNCGYHLDRNDH